VAAGMLVQVTADMAAGAGTATANMPAGAGTAAVAAGTKPQVGRAVGAAGTITADISAGTSTGRVIPDGEEASPQPNSSMAGLGQGLGVQDLSVRARTGGI